ncbi:parB-like partition protein [Anaeromyxobacter dehalogenans 2CP-1]|uniref:ParB-like partition protein n=1 Tax=Anaeromyxobacter dehalogenans (strain ATCC BAA-258 / DSM 21875 / 2CP-1) TaxID=455488 RepID=B8JFA2_ANAD2|nr:ParB/RepB/Spo0J family partition protein [Anaeromyxobacter dehalogenans]ACL64459.1 parB-like partition protein [Anaeromyxobacter dehalogenans 2CP-1]
MSDRVSGRKAGSEERAVPAEPFEKSAQAAKVLGNAEAELRLELREIPLDAIEPDPAQPRRVFDEEKLRSLVTSIRKYGVLQEPGVVPVAGEGASAAVRYRLIWGERRWRASRLAGLTALRCKVLPRAADSAIEKLRTKERQWAENMEREGLSPVEEAIAIRDAAELERTLRPEVALGELIEKVGAERGLHGTVARNLVALLKTPDSLQRALLARSIKREVGFELARLWNKLLAQNNLRGGAKRETQYRNLVASWARARGLELGTQAMTRYAAETFQDPKIVKATCRKAEESERALLSRFDDVVTRAAKERWTVAKTKAEVAALRRDAADGRPPTASSRVERVEDGPAPGPYTGAP